MISFLLAIMVTAVTTEAVGSITSMTNNILAYAAVEPINSSTSITSQSFSLDKIETKKVRLGDIDIAYKIFGKGKPLLLIPGFSMTMGMWDPNMLNMLSSTFFLIFCVYAVR
jgi:hypothetical protein